jgi:hypothetical protein
MEIDKKYTVKIKASIAKDSGFETFKNVSMSIENNWLVVNSSTYGTTSFNLDKVYSYQIFDYIEEVVEEENPWLA